MDYDLLHAQSSEPNRCAKRSLSRLFIEQDPKSPDAVIPVYYSFLDAKLDSRAFVIIYG